MLNDLTGRSCHIVCAKLPGLEENMARTYFLSNKKCMGFIDQWAGAFDWIKLILQAEPDPFRNIKNICQKERSVPSSYLHFWTHRSRSTSTPKPALSFVCQIGLRWTLLIKIIADRSWIWVIWMAPKWPLETTARTSSYMPALIYCK